MDVISNIGTTATFAMACGLIEVGLERMVLPTGSLDSPVFWQGLTVGRIIFRDGSSAVVRVAKAVVRLFCEFLLHTFIVCAWAAIPLLVLGKWTPLGVSVFSMAAAGVPIAVKLLVVIFERIFHVHPMTAEVLRREDEDLDEGRRDSILTERWWSRRHYELVSGGLEMLRLFLSIVAR
jgi:hypothetical protein